MGWQRTCAAAPVGAGGLHVAVARAGLQVLHMRDHADHGALQLHIPLAVRQDVGLRRAVICMRHLYIRRQLSLAARCHKQCRDMQRPSALPLMAS